MLQLEDIVVAAAYSPKAATPTKYKYFQHETTETRREEVQSSRVSLLLLHP